MALEHFSEYELLALGQFSCHFPCEQAPCSTLNRFARCLKQMITHTIAEVQLDFEANS